jgi:hypothetical protein
MASSIFGFGQGTAQPSVLFKRSVLTARPQLDTGLIEQSLRRLLATGRHWATRR